MKQKQVTYDLRNVHHRVYHIVYAWLWITLCLFIIGSMITGYVTWLANNNPEVSIIEPDKRQTVTSVDELLSESSNRLVSAVDRLSHPHPLRISSVIEPTCSSRGFTVYICDCGAEYLADEIPMLDHVWGNWAITKHPTEKTTGVKWRKCLYCDANEYGEVPELSKKRKPTKDNYLGRWEIPDVGVDVAIYRQYDTEGADIVDAIDSATFFYTHAGGMVIGDHVHQGFRAIKSCEPGTIARIVYDNGETKEFVCREIIQGHNNSKYLTDSDGNSLYDIYKNSLLCYTCNETWENVTIVVFDPV